MREAAGASGIATMMSATPFGADIVDGMDLDDVVEDVVGELLIVRRRLRSGRSSHETTARSGGTPR